MERHLSKIRTPTALVTLPAHGVLVIGFDSGEIQTYDIGIYDLVHKVSRGLKILVGKEEILPCSNNVLRIFC